MKKTKDSKKIFEAEDKIEQDERLWQALKETAAFKKVDSFIMDLARKPEFIKSVNSFRKEFGIPINGFKYPKSSSQFEEMVYIRDEKYTNKIFKLAKNYASPAYYDFLESYLLFGNTDAVSDYMDTQFDVIEIIDVKLALSNVEAGFESDVSFETYHLKTVSKINPVGIMIHPYMSQRDVIDAVKKLYKLQIEPLQKKYRNEKIKLGIVRRKSKRVEERNKFIYKNRFGRSKKELISLVREKFGEVMDETYINKIIKDERDRQRK